MAVEAEGGSPWSQLLWFRDAHKTLDHAWLLDRGSRGALAGRRGVWRHWDPAEAERKGRSAKVARVCLPALLICLGLKPQQKGQWLLKPCPGLAQQCVPSPVSTVAACLVKQSSPVQSERTPTKRQFVQWCVLLTTCVAFNRCERSERSCVHFTDCF